MAAMYAHEKQMRLCAEHTDHNGDNERTRRGLGRESDQTTDYQ